MPSSSFATTSFRASSSSQSASPRRSISHGLFTRRAERKCSAPGTRVSRPRRGAEVARPAQGGGAAEGGGDPLPGRGRQAALVEPDGAAANAKGAEKGGERVSRARRVSFHELADAPHVGVSAVVVHRGKVVEAREVIDVDAFLDGRGDLDGGDRKAGART